ncbi:PREDICTED: cytochrome P450 2G1-like [Nanorana parkeri]|uniref:cytochrome P450 2G1-like n=1 Tax=Nanorana parkeri TaxID=125878 RepID=UPI00085481F0|nr:PREDICTED: cytochrome P450 2G1-like [Nanorana parkeri]
MDLPVDITVFLIIVLSILFLYFGVKTFWTQRHLPPGPTPLPLLGNVLEVGGGDIVNSLMKLSKKYGEVFTVYLGSRPTVVVTGYTMVKEVLLDKGDDFLSRGDMPSWDLFFDNSGMIFTKNMNEWRDLRRFSLTTLREMGFGKRNVESLIQEEFQNLVEELREIKESFIDPRMNISRAHCKVILSIMFGNRQEIEQKDIDMVLRSLHETFMVISSPWGQIFEMFPGVMKYIPGHHQKIFQSLGRLSQYAEEKVQMNKKTLDPDNPGNYVDYFLLKIEKEKVNPHSSFCMKTLLASTVQIFFAAVETMITTMIYSLLVVMKYPEVIAKVQKEIEHVIGRRSPTVQDRNNMPYTEAVLHEMQRFIDLIPMGAVRRTTAEVTLNGYTLPKDINVITMLTSVLKDPTCFNYPTEFNPENFLNDKGEFQRNSAFMPLSAGKRMCLGETVVRMVLFLFLVNVLQNFDLKSPVPLEELDITPIVSGLGNVPKPYKVAFIPR